jgi:predicted  nucleic acid-binding Zn-ribbon protein
MNDPKKSAEAVKKIQELQNKIQSHSSRVSQIENEKNVRIRYFDQQIKSERDQIQQHSRQIDELKRQI